MKILVNVPKQTMSIFEGYQVIAKYLVSTSRNGVGELLNSEKTPRGWHQIRAKIGGDCQINTVFINRRPTGEIFCPSMRQLYPKREWILTRILWLSGLEVGKNRLGSVDTMRRYVYIHGCGDDVDITIPRSRGCICMLNQNLMDLYNRVIPGTQVYIDEYDSEHLPSFENML